MAATAILFPGQGAQEIGMGRSFHERHAAARDVFAEANDVLGYSLSQYCFEGPLETLTRTEHAQAAIYVTSVAAVRGLEEDGLLDRSAIGAAAGLSLGEYTALWFAGAIEFASGLRLVRQRGLAMQQASEAVPSGMTSLLGADFATATAVCDAARGSGVLEVANVNAPGQIVLSGDCEALARAAEVAKTHGVRRAIRLNVAGAFHSPIMEPARSALAAALAGVEFQKLRIPVYSNVHGLPVQDEQTARELLALQVVSPVLWGQSIRRMISDGFQRFLEAPPGRILTGLLRKIAPEASAMTLDAGEG